MWRLRRMLRSRRFSERVLDHADLVVGPRVSAIGYQCIAAAIASARDNDDAVLLSHRNHHVLAADLAALCSEIFARDLAPPRGRAGSMHLSAPNTASSGPAR